MPESRVVSFNESGIGEKVFKADPFLSIGEGDTVADEEVAAILLRVWTIANSEKSTTKAKQMTRNEGLNQRRKESPDDAITLGIQKHKVSKYQKAQV